MNLSFILTICIFGILPCFAQSLLPQTSGEPQCEIEVANMDQLCGQVEKILESGINRDVLKQALTFKALNPLLDSDEIMVADYSKNSREERLYRINLTSGSVSKIQVSHGGGHVAGGNGVYYPRLQGEGIHWGDRNHDGMLDACKVPERITASWPPSLRENNRENMTRPGFFATKVPRNYRHKNNWTQFGADGVNAIPMQGLTEEINADAEEEKVALNAPTYNSSNGRGGLMGRGSYGPAIRPRDRGFLRSIPPNTIFYSFVPTCREDMEIVFNQIPGWENMCEPNSGQTLRGNCDRVENGNRQPGKDIPVEGTPISGEGGPSTEER